MTTSDAAAPAPAAAPGGFDLQSFAPSWGASVMGTSALSVALLAVGEGSSLAGPTQVAARVVLVLALVMGVLVLGATAARWVRFRAEARADLRHPVKGGMTATAAGGLLTLAVAIGKVGPGLLPDPFILPTVTVLAVVGALLALLIGWEFLAEVFTSQDAVLAQMSGAWFVPPVVTIIVPLALLPVIAGNPSIAADLVALSWAFLGMGAVLYLVVTAVLFMRSISHPLPPAGLAPTLFIGMGPAGLMGLDMVRLSQASVQAGVAEPSLVTSILPFATMMWGFGLWWMVAALVVLRRGYPTLPFTLSWWGFTFPLAAWTIATIVLGNAWDSGLVTALGWVATSALLTLWGYVATRTVLGIRTGSIWAH
jgi:C4-dicarboxylate transporter/malic acid transport protein